MIWNITPRTTLKPFLFAVVATLLVLAIFQYSFRPHGASYLRFPAKPSPAPSVSLGKASLGSNDTTKKTDLKNVTVELRLKNVTKKLVNTTANAKAAGRHRSNNNNNNNNDNNKMSTTFSKRYLLHWYPGRLGNVLFQFASVFCIAKLNNLTLVVKTPIHFREFAHQQFTVRSQRWVPDTPVQAHPRSNGCEFDGNLFYLRPTKSSHAVEGYFQSWRYFEPCKAEVMEATRFKDSVLNIASNIVGNLKRKYVNRTLVGIHVRMEDYLLTSEKVLGRKTAPTEYYHKAMTYFRSRFPAVTFMVVASSTAWFQTNVSKGTADVVILPRNPSPAVDMEVLSRLDHLILSVGTFGWWAGYKSRGTVIAYKDFFVPGSNYGRKMGPCSVKNFFYPGWVTL